MEEYDLNLFATHGRRHDLEGARRAVGGRAGGRQQHQTIGLPHAAASPFGGLMVRFVDDEIVFGLDRVEPFGRLIGIARIRDQHAPP